MPKTTLIYLIKPGPPPTIVFGISSVQNILFPHVQQPANSRIKRSCQGLWLDVTGSTVQKAVVVLAAKPVFGPIRYVRTSIFSFSRILFLSFSRDKLHVITNALSCKLEGMYVLWLRIQNARFTGISATRVFLTTSKLLWNEPCADN